MALPVADELLQVIYSDKDSIVVNKPAGMVTHTAGNVSTEQSVAGILLKRFPELRSVGEDSLRPGIVHRLDKDTSGVLLVARNQDAFNYFKTLFQQRKIIKTYTALVFGKLPTKGTIDFPIGRSSRDPTRRVAVRASLGAAKTRGALRDAVTTFRAKEYFQCTEADRRKKRIIVLTLVEAAPQTGRTHQLRVHFSAIGHPIVCDKRYGGRRAYCPPGLERQFLHASSLQFVSRLGKHLCIEAGLADDAMEVLSRLRYLNNYDI